MKRGSRGQGPGSSVIFYIIYIIAISVLFLSTISFAETRDASFAKAEKLFLEDKYDRVIYETDRLIEERASNRDEIYYLRGLSNLKLNKFKDARVDFNTILERYPGSKRAFDAALGVGDTYFLEGDKQAAARTYEKILSDYSSNRNISVVRDRFGKCEIARPKVSSDKPANNIIFLDDISDKKDDRKIEGRNGDECVQVGCFKSKGNADRFAAKLRRAGYDSYVDHTAGVRGTLYKVKVGKNLSKTSCEELAKKLKRDGYSTKICQ